MRGAKYLWLIVALLIPTAVNAGLVQQMASPGSTSISPATLTLPANSTIGNLLTVTCITRDSSGSIGPLPTITGLATTWTVQADSGTGNNQRAIIWTGTATSAGTSITVTFSGGTSPKVGCSTQEWTPYTTLDIAAANSNNSTTITSTVLNTTQAVDLVLIIAGHNVSTAPTASPGAPWVTLNQITGSVPPMYAVYQITSATGAYSATWTWALATDNGAAAVAMYVPVAAGATASLTFQ